MKKNLLIFILAVLVLTSLSCGVQVTTQPHTPTEFIQVIYAYKITSDNKLDTIFFAKASSLGFKYNLLVGDGPSLDEVTNMTDAESKTGLQISVKDNLGNSLSGNTDLTGHLHLIIPFTVSVLKVNGWQCGDVYAWQNLGQGNIVQYGGGTIMCGR